MITQCLSRTAVDPAPLADAIQQIDTPLQADPSAAEGEMCLLAILSESSNRPAGDVKKRHQPLAKDAPAHFAEFA